MVIQPRFVEAWSFNGALARVALVEGTLRRYVNVKGDLVGPDIVDVPRNKAEIESISDVVGTSEDELKRRFGTPRTQETTSANMARWGHDYFLRKTVAERHFKAPVKVLNYYDETMERRYWLMETAKDTWTVVRHVVTTQRE